MRYLIKFSYDGRSYCGFQTQPKLKTIQEELENALKDKEFLISAFRYEMSNHEYYVTYDKTETLAKLGISYDEFMSNVIMKEAWKIAQDDYFKKMEEMGW